MSDPRYLLLQIREREDPMCGQEVGCFSRTLGCPRDRIDVHDLLSGRAPRAAIDAVDAVLLGGSGDYSVAAGGPWLEPALETMRELHRIDKPTFASCWGFQAMARAMGGEVITDPARAEVGTYELRATLAGREDPLFGPLGDRFQAQVGHMDVVHRLPADAVLLASSELTEHHAFRFAGKPIYCTQFHPELSRESFLERLRTYPEYVRTITGLPYETFVTRCSETTATEGILQRFVERFVQD